MKLSSKNLFMLQLIAHLITCYWVVSIATLTDYWYVLLVYFCTGCIGMSVTYHRLLTHKSFVAPKWFEYIGTLFATVGLTGSSITWTAAHRQHHARADKQGDPHSPSVLGYIKAQWFSMFSDVDIKRSPVLRDRFHLFVHRHYLYIQFAWGLILLSLGGPWALMTLYIVPACLLWNAGSLINTVCHTTWLGYTNHYVQDNSVNNPVLGVVMWGEGWHNNHHRHQNNPSIGERWWEVDIGYWVIKLVRKNQ
jgi:stearoyl-CoA desaturase (delta-9 desaturase)